MGTKYDVKLLVLAWTESTAPPHRLVVYCGGNPEVKVTLNQIIDKNVFLKCFRAVHANMLVLDALESKKENGPNQLR